MREISDVNPFKGYGARIRLARQYLGWTQIQCAEKCGLEQSQVSHWEREKHLPNSDSWQRLAVGMGLPDYWLKWGSREPVMVRRLIPNVYEASVDDVREITTEQHLAIRAARSHKKR